jgi:hypothetical protein
MSKRPKSSGRPLGPDGCPFCVDELNLDGPRCVVHNPPGPDVLLLVGGPVNGQEIEVPAGTPSWVHIGTASKYRRVRLGQFSPNALGQIKTWERDFMLHESVTDQPTAFSLLTTVVTHRWFQQGRERDVTEEERDALTARQTAHRVNGGSPHRPSGLIVP